MMPFTKPSTLHLAVATAALAWSAVACNAVSGLTEFVVDGGPSESGPQRAITGEGDAGDDEAIPAPSETEDGDATSETDAGAEVVVDGASDVDAGPAIPPDRKYVFVTANAYTSAEFGGLAGADAECARLATSAGRGGTWKAWISDSSVNAYDRMKGDGPWYTFDDRLAVDGRSELQGGSITKAINVDETGKTGVAQRVWTGASGDARTQSCSDWSVSYTSCIGLCAGAVVGNSGQSSASWAVDGDLAPCKGNARLYCFQQ